MYSSSTLFPRIIFVSAVLIGCAALVYIATRPPTGARRITASPSISSPAGVATTGTSNTPLMTDLSGEEDSLQALAPQWTYLRQTPLSTQNHIISGVDAVTPVRESVVKVIGKNTGLLLDEFRMTDREALVRQLQAAQAQNVKLADRDGYLVNIDNMTGGTGLFLVGETTALLLQSTESAFWPTTPEAEVLTYLKAVRVR